MGNSALELARRLARNAEAVCRHYLSNGWRFGRYWVVGDVMNTPGKSTYGHFAGGQVHEHAPEYSLRDAFWHVDDRVFICGASDAAFAMECQR